MHLTRGVYHTSVINQKRRIKRGETKVENTSFAEGFDIFRKIHEEEFDTSNKNFLKMYMLNTNNKLFSYQELYDHILDNITNYVFSRSKISEAEKDNRKRKKIILEAINRLRPIDSEQDLGAGGELGEILLYLFLEQDLHAPKLFSKVELKTNNKDYVKGSDGIHFRFRTNSSGHKILQLVIGEAKIQNSLRSAIDEAFSSINAYLTSNIQDIILLDSHLMDQLVDKDEAAELKTYLFGLSRKKREIVFGIFIGYTIEYTGANDNNDEYDVKVIDENIKQVLKLKHHIINQINKHNISNYEFNFFFLPFHDAAKDRRAIMKALTEGKPYLPLGDIRNG